MDKKYDYLKYTPTLPGKIAIGIATPLLELLQYFLLLNFRRRLL